MFARIEIKLHGPIGDEPISIHKKKIKLIKLIKMTLSQLAPVSPLSDELTIKTSSKLCPLSFEWLRGKVIQVQNLMFFCLCHFGKVKYIGNNILKYRSNPLKISRFINQHVFSRFQN